MEITNCDVRKDKIALRSLQYTFRTAQLESGEIEVAAIDPLAAMNVTGNEKIEVYAKEVNKNLQRVLNNI